MPETREQLAIRLYEFMGGIKTNWLKEAAVIREEYRAAAQRLLDAKEWVDGG